MMRKSLVSFMATVLMIAIPVFSGLAVAGCDESANPGSDVSDSQVVNDNGTGQDTVTVAAKWRCTVCDWVYDPAKGDATQGIAPGTRFEDLPATWKCPECGLGKEVFVKIE